MILTHAERENAWLVKGEGIQLVNKSSDRYRAAIPKTEATAFGL